MVFKSLWITSGILEAKATSPQVGGFFIWRQNESLYPSRNPARDKPSPTEWATVTGPVQPTGSPTVRCLPGSAEPGELRLW